MGLTDHAQVTSGGTRRPRSPGSFPFSLPVVVVVCICLRCCVAFPKTLFGVREVYGTVPNQRKPLVCQSRIRPACRLLVSLWESVNLPSRRMQKNYTRIIGTLCFWAMMIGTRSMYVAALGNVTCYQRHLGSGFCPSQSCLFFFFLLLLLLDKSK